MARKKLSKVELALRQELANAIHDMDDGKLENSRLQTLQSKINNKLYDNGSDDDDYEEDEVEILPTLAYSYDDYVDNIDWPESDLGYTVEDTLADLRCAIEELACCTDEKKVPKFLKVVEKEFANYNKEIKEYLVDANKEAKASMTSADKQLKKLKVDLEKDLNNLKKGKKNASKSTLL